MQPQSSKPTKTGRFAKLNLRHISFRRVGYLLAALVIIAGGYYAYLWYSNRKPADNAYAFSYSKLSNVKIPGENPGSGISIDRPVEMQALSPIDEKTTQATMFQVYAKNNNPTILAEIALASVKTSINPDAKYIETLNAQLTDPKNPQHATATKSIQDFISQRIIPPNYSINYSDPKVFSTETIKNNIWYVAYTMTAKDKSKSTPLNTPDMQGEAILAVGKSTFYYYKIDMLKVNWQTNQAVRDQIINSIKIDQ